MSRSRKAIIVVLSAILAMAMFGMVGCGSPEPAKAPEPTPAAAPDAPAIPEFTTVTPGTITVGSDCDYPPFIELNKQGQPEGFELEMVQAIAAKLGTTATYLEPQNFDSILAQVAADKKMDLGLSSFTITTDRQKLVDFCTPYFDSNQAVVALKADGLAPSGKLTQDETIKALKAQVAKGKKIGAQSGTTGADWIKENISKDALVNFTQTSEALAALKAGKIIAAVYDQPVAADHVSEGGTYAKDAEVIAEIPTGEQYGIAVSKSNPGLKAAINQAFVEIVKDGTYGTIFAKYFKFEPSLTPDNIDAAVLASE